VPGVEVAGVATVGVSAKACAVSRIWLILACKSLMRVSMLAGFSAGFRGTMAKSKLGFNFSATEPSAVMYPPERHVNDSQPFIDIMLYNKGKSSFIFL